LKSFWQFVGTCWIKDILKDIQCGDVDWTDLAQDSDQWGDSCECGNEPSGSIKDMELFDCLSGY